MDDATLEGRTLAAQTLAARHHFDTCGYEINGADIRGYKFGAQTRGPDYCFAKTYFVGNIHQILLD